MASLLRDSVKFLLQGNGYLFADHDFKPGMFDLQHLPFPICALEFTAAAELYAEGSGLSHAAKRIALCFDPKKLSESQLESLTSCLCGRPFMEELPERSLAVMAVYESNGVWGGAVGLVLIDLEAMNSSEEPGAVLIFAARLNGRLALLIGPSITQH